jgi:hypothetical protein
MFGTTAVVTPLSQYIAANFSVPPTVLVELSSDSPVATVTGDPLPATAGKNQHA